MDRIDESREALSRIVEDIDKAGESRELKLEVATRQEAMTKI